MLFPEEDTPLLKTWIVKRLENTTDADADVLADYVLALLRQDNDPAEVRTLFMAEIPDFLQEHTEGFTQDLFDAVQWKSYLPGGGPPRRPSLPFAPPLGPSTPSYGNIGMGAPPLGPSGDSRKRSYNDRGDGDSQDRGFQGGDPNGRMYKQPRRGARGGFDGFNGRGGFPGGRGSPMNIQGLPPPQGFPNMPGMPSPPPGMPPFDSNNPMATMLAMQAMGFPLPSFPTPGSPGVGGPPRPHNMHPKKQRCRDYDQKGFCARGNTCMFEHGENSIFVPPGSKGDEYDPTNAGLMSGVESNGGPVGLSSRGSSRGGDRGRGRGGFQRGDRGGPHGNASRRGGRAEFSSDRPNFDTSKTTIVVENIPEDKFSEDSVREFFSEFGNILEVSMRPYKRLAIIKYDDWNSANTAYKSPKVIFDNRFVKVYWFSDTDSLPKPPGVTGANGSPMNGAGPLSAAPDRKASEPAIDMEEFARKQEEAQKVHEEKMKKKQEVENSRKELEKRQENLLKSQAEEKRKLMERIAAKSGKSGATPSDKESEAPSSAGGQTTSQTEALKAQLAALEAEAQSLGIDPSATEEPSFGGYRGRGRGRGASRARGTYAPRGFRGGFRGRGGAPFAGGGAYKLDNRPRKIAMTGADFTNAENDESLRQFLLVSTLWHRRVHRPRHHTPKTSITFKDRFTAEKFMYGLPGGELPSVGKVDMAWVQTPLAPINLSTSTSTSTPVKTEDSAMAMDEGDAMVPTYAPEHADLKREHVENLDYDVADDNDWGIQ
ncbi:putative RNA-binding protein [Lachnellula occidentalis]|uniref:Putative RNA-binding protein n=1 Tax=Lachnellula occidentalis TaxID=215460 RepID=A0A8H8RY36_9HELO|nr:putative RNA-binding protein [Lachnellula occidentalis]